MNTFEHDTGSSGDTGLYESEIVLEDIAFTEARFTPNAIHQSWSEACSFAEDNLWEAPGVGTAYAVLPQGGTGEHFRFRVGNLVAIGTIKSRSASSGMVVDFKKIAWRGTSVCTSGEYTFAAEQ